MASSGPPRLVEFSELWAEVAAKRIVAIRSALALPNEVGALEHIGSTAVPGLAAKPIIDLQWVVSELSEADSAEPSLNALGYFRATGSRPDSPGVHRDMPRGEPGLPAGVWAKRLYYYDDVDLPTILHIRLSSSPFARQTLLFRDWLRAHPEEAKKYQDEKRHLAAQHAHDADYDDYTRGKTAFFDYAQPKFEFWGARRRT